MKKALKIIFGIALGCFLLGCVVLGIGIATGGTMREFVEAVQNNKFAFHWDITDWEGQDKGTASTEETAFAPEDVKSLDIDMDAGMLKVVKGKGKEIKVITTSKNAEVETALEDGTLIISENFHAAYWGDGVHRLQVVIEVPEQLELEELSVEVGAGDIDIKEGLLTTAYASFDVDAGNLDFAGEVKGDLDADCNVGNMELKLTGEQQDYNYSLSCGVGSIKAGDISVADCFEMANLLCGEFKKGEFGHIDLCYTKFVSMLSQQPSAIPVLPLKDLTDEQDTKSIRNLILYEPDASEVFDAIVPEYLAGLIYGAVCESVASELAARRTAMEAATNNAEEMIEKLNLHYNRARQASITQEITEIVGGAEGV